jgi:hypothetical protein
MGWEICPLVEFKDDHITSILLLENLENTLNFLICGTSHGRLIKIDIINKSYTYLFPKCARCITCLNKYKNILIVSDGTGEIMLLNISNNFSIIKRFAAHKTWICNFVVVGDKLITINFFEIRLWDLETFDILECASVPYGTYVCAISSNSIAIGYNNGTIDIMTLPKFTIVSTTEKYNQPIIKIVSGKHTFFSLYRDDTVIEWSIKDYTAIRTIRASELAENHLFTLTGCVLENDNFLAIEGSGNVTILENDKSHHDIAQLKYGMKSEICRYGIGKLIIASGNYIDLLVNKDINVFNETFVPAHKRAKSSLIPHSLLNTLPYELINEIRKEF